MSEVFPQFKYTFRLDGKPMRYAIQSAYIGSNYAYALTHYDGNDNNNGMNSYLYRGSINIDTDVINLSSNDKMTLSGFGHNQSLTFYQHYNHYDGQIHDYFLTTMRGNSNDSNRWVLKLAALNIKTVLLIILNAQDYPILVV